MEGIFSKTPPHPSGNSNKAKHISLNFWVLQNPPTPGNSNILCGGSMDIFWMCTILHDVYYCSFSLVSRLAWNGVERRFQRQFIGSNMNVIHLLIPMCMMSQPSLCRNTSQGNLAARGWCRK